MKCNSDIRSITVKSIRQEEESEFSWTPAVTFWFCNIIKQSVEPEKKPLINRQQPGLIWKKEYGNYLHQPCQDFSRVLVILCIKLYPTAHRIMRSNWAQHTDLWIWATRCTETESFQTPCNLPAAVSSQDQLLIHQPDGGRLLTAQMCAGPLRGEWNSAAGESKRICSAYCRLT